MFIVHHHTNNFIGAPGALYANQCEIVVRQRRLPPPGELSWFHEYYYDIYV